MQFNTVLTHLQDDFDSHATLLTEELQRSQFINELKQKIFGNWSDNVEYALTLARLLYQFEHDSGGKETAVSSELIEEISEQFAGSADETNVHVYDSAIVNAVVTRLKQKVDQFQWRDKQQAITYAKAIIRLGEQCNHPRHIALGEMALGDCILQLGNHFQEAWEWNGRAADRFLQDGDVIGWARTCIGRLAMCIELDRTAETEKAAAVAQYVLEQFKSFDLLIRLAINLSKLQNDLGRYEKTETIFNETIPIALKLEEMAEQHLGFLYNNMGLAKLYQSDFHQAKEYYDLAQSVFTQQKKLAARDVIYQSLAYIDRMHGNYKEALRRLHTILHRMEGENSIYKVHVQMHIIECYFFLNRIEEARTMASDIVEQIAQLNDAFPQDLGLALSYLGRAEGYLGLYDSAERRFAQAIDIFTAIKSETWRQLTRLLRGELALLQGKFSLAQRLAEETAAYFQTTNQQDRQARALMLQAQAAFSQQAWQRSHKMAQTVWRHAKKLNHPSLRYRVHLLMGKIALEDGRQHQAQRHLLAANIALWRQQRRLTITLRGDFMADKDESLHTYLKLLLKQNKTHEACTALEQSKSHLFLQYLSDRQQFIWQKGNPIVEDLTTELNRVREKHYHLYHYVHNNELFADDNPKLPLEIAQQQLIICEQNIRSLTEQLYLQSGNLHSAFSTLHFPISQVQQKLEEDAFAAEFYTDGEAVWVFVIEQAAITAIPLDISSNAIQDRLDKLLFNIRCALHSQGHSANLLWIAKKLGQQLYSGLVAPLQPWLDQYQRVYLVPYSLLHGLPFNILHNGDTYFAETHELVVLPAATLLGQPAPRQPAGALLLGHSHHGRLPHVNTELAALGQRLGAAVYTDVDCTRSRLEQPPRQILHLAAHGQHRLDHPDLSFIDLADGKLFIDDLIQQDLGYELVVLSACETGRAAIQPGEELIGFGRSVLLAGAGALVGSLWQVEDEATAALMELFYEALQKGFSKAAALQIAQQQLLVQQPDLHPAFWGAFQLVGNPDPLSMT